MTEEGVDARGEIARQLDASAQHAVDEPERIDVHAADLHERIASKFGGVVADRAARTMVIAVVDHRVSLHEIDWMHEQQQHGASLLAPDDGIEHYIVPEYPNLGTSRYRGTPYAAFMNTLAYWHRRAHAAVLAELRRDPDDPVLRELQARQLRYSKGRSTAERLLAQVPIEQVEVTLVLLIARQRACTHHPDEHGLLRLVIGDLAMLDRGTTLHRARLRQILPRFPTVTNEIACQAQWPDQSTDDDLFAGTEQVFEESEHPHAHWRHLLLRDGPAPDPGFCTGRPILRPATEPAREGARRFFAEQAARVGIQSDPPTDGAFRSASVLLTIGANVAVEAPWTSPPQ